MIRPPRIQPGARIALVTPAGPIAADRIRAAHDRVRALGCEPVDGASIRERLGYLAGPDAARAADLRRAVEDDTIDAIWAIRGGYGAIRLLRRIDPSPLRERAKPFIGFSDNTALHLALARAGIVSFHGPHAGADAFPPFTEAGFRSVLLDPRPAGELPLPDDGTAVTTLVSGRAEGELIGGNLALLAATCGTPVELDARGRIVIIEDVGEPVYRIDRMLMQLALAGALDGAAGLAFGRFTNVPRRRRDRPLQEVLADFARMIRVPAVRDVPVGHIAECWTLPFGVPARLDADAGTLELLDAGVE